MNLSLACSRTKNGTFFSRVNGKDVCHTRKRLILIWALPLVHLKDTSNATKQNLHFYKEGIHYMNLRKNCLNISSLHNIVLG